MLNMGFPRLRKSFAVAFGHVLEFRGLRPAGVASNPSTTRHLPFERSIQLINWIISGILCSFHGAD